MSLKTSQRDARSIREFKFIIYRDYSNFPTWLSSQCLSPLPLFPLCLIISCVYIVISHCKSKRLILWFFPSDITKNIMPQTETESLHTVCNLRRVSSFGFFFCIVRWRKKKFISIELKMKEKSKATRARWKWKGNWTKR